MAEKNTRGVFAPTEIVKNLFGDHPEDVISPIGTATEALGWLEEIFNIIAKEAARDVPNGIRIKRLSEAGAYLALDLGDYAGRMHETYLERLKTAGVVSSREELNHG